MVRRMFGVLALSFLFAFPSSSFARVEFFGVKILNTKMILSCLTKVRENSEGGVLYSVQEQYADDSVNAYASVGANNITFTIQNKSKTPLKMNFFTDKYEWMDTDNAVYQLEVPQKSISDYPRILNPKESASVTAYGFKGRLEEIKYVSVTIGLSKTFILLKKIEPYKAPDKK